MDQVMESPSSGFTSVVAYPANGNIPNFMQQTLQNRSLAFYFYRNGQRKVQPGSARVTSRFVREAIASRQNLNCLRASGRSWQNAEL
jgi:hypothetical protein